jgi:2-methylisocitrate lyase-like PEP mutase family enzyme
VTSPSCVGAPLPRLAARRVILLLAGISRGFDETLGRLKVCVAEGSDILFLDSRQSETEIRDAVAACNGKPPLAVTSAAGRHFMPGNSELERIGIKLVVYPQDILAATVHAALGGLKRTKPPMASPAELATAIRSADSSVRDGRWPHPR